MGVAAFSKKDYYLSWKFGLFKGKNFRRFSIATDDWMRGMRPQHVHTNVSRSISHL